MNRGAHRGEHRRSDHASDRPITGAVRTGRTDDARRAQQLKPTLRPPVQRLPGLVTGLLDNSHDERFARGVTSDPPAVRDMVVRRLEQPTERLTLLLKKRLFSGRRLECSKWAVLPHREVPEIRAIASGSGPGGGVRSIGSGAGSRESRKVPQCIGHPHPTSHAGCTASSASMCMFRINQRGAYALMGSIAASLPG